MTVYKVTGGAQTAYLEARNIGEYLYEMDERKEVTVQRLSMSLDDFEALGDL